MNVPSEVTLRPMRPGEIGPVQALAREIWHHHYPGIITPAQIEYMLAQRYSREVLEAELARDDVWWDVAEIGGVLLAFSSYLLAEGGAGMKLDKLYVHPEWQRRGIGGRLIERAAQVARERGHRRLALAVNKHNVHAISSYRRHGFVIEGAVVKDIGDGFVMDDYIMVRTP